MMLRFDNVAFGYDDDGLVLDGLDLEIGRGEHVALLGRNGSGKSTIARLANGLLLPSSGKVTVDGLDTSDRENGAAVKRLVQLVFQNPENQQIGTTVYEDIAFGLSTRNIPTGDMPVIAQEALTRAGLDVDLNREVSSLSGGELQRLALASVIALKPSYLILDEATSMLDAGNRNRLLEVVRRLKSDGITIIQITHYLDEVENADRAIVLINGRIARDSTPGAIFRDHPLLSEAGLEPLDRPLRPKRAKTPGNQVLSIDGCSYAYGRRGTPATLKNASFSVRKGEMVAITGKSGAGKTTLVNMMKGLLKPQNGEILIDESNPWAGKKNRRLFDRIGYVFQHCEHQLFEDTVGKDVAYALQGLNLAEEEIRTRVDGELGNLGLNPHEIIDRSPFALSGGQQRRVALAGILVADPEVVLLDEPTAGLDYPSRERLFSELRSIADSGRSVIWVSHREREIQENADRVIRVENGYTHVEESQ